MKNRLLLGAVLNAKFQLIKLRQRQATKPLCDMPEYNFTTIEK